VLESIEELKLFEADYREQLRRYIEDQLENLIQEEASVVVAPAEPEVAEVATEPEEDDLSGEGN